MVACGCLAVLATKAALAAQLDTRARAFLAALDELQARAHPPPPLRSGRVFESPACAL